MKNKKDIATRYGLPAAIIFFPMVIFAQQNVIANKDNTRPEINQRFFLPARVTMFTAIRNNGYNEIKWTGTHQQDTRKYIVEYSINGINFQTAGEMPVNNSGIYQLQHQTFDPGPMFYRVRSEDINGKYTISPVALLNGEGVDPVSLYPTIVSGNTINLVANLPVERIQVLSASGIPVYTQDINGREGNFSLLLPALEKGIYFITYYGRGWKSSSRFIIG